MGKSVPIILAGLLALASSAGAAGPSLLAQYGAARTLSGAAVAVGGRVTIVNFWATWCVPCRAELPLIDGWYRRHVAQGVTVVAVAMDDGAPIGRLRAATAGLMLPVVPIARVRMARRDIPNGLPVTRIYDRGGVLRFDSQRDGRRTVDAATLDRIVVPLLEGR